MHITTHFSGMIRSTQRASDTSTTFGTAAAACRRCDIVRELDLSVRKHPSMSGLNGAGFFQDSGRNNDRLLSPVTRTPGMTSVRLLLLLR